MGAEAGKDCSPTGYRPLHTFLSPKHVWHIPRRKRDLLRSRSRRGRDAWSLGHTGGARTNLPMMGSVVGGGPLKWHHTKHFPSPGSSAERSTQQEWNQEALHQPGCNAASQALLRATSRLAGCSWWWHKKPCWAPAWDRGVSPWPPPVLPWGQTRLRNSSMRWESNENVSCGSERLDKSDHSVCWKKLHNPWSHSGP